MSFKEEHPEMWNEAIRKFGYICPECGNNKTFRQYWRIVKEVSCDEDTGIIDYSDTEYANDLHPLIVEVECTECGAQAIICKKGAVINVFNHDSVVKYANNVR